MGWLSDRWDQVTNAVEDVGKIAVSSVAAPIVATNALVSGNSVNDAIADLPGSRDEATKVALAAAVVAGGYVSLPGTGVTEAATADAIIGSDAVAAGAATGATTATGTTAAAGAGAVQTGTLATVASAAKTGATIITTAASVKAAADKLGGAANKAQDAASSVKDAADKANRNQDYAMVILIGLFGYAIIKG